VNYSRIPLNLPHAGTVAGRIVYHLQRRGVPIECAKKLLALLDPYRDRDDPPSPEEAKRVVEEAARLGRGIVEEIERAGAEDDRLGQSIRNLFECLELGEEGARISLRAGEDPNSALRPG